MCAHANILNYIFQNILILKKIPNYSDGNQCNHVSLKK